MINVIAVGDDSVGKTSLLIVLNKKPFKEFNTPILYDIYKEEIFCEQEKYVLIIWDTSNREDYKLRQLAYLCGGKHVFLLCFSLNSKKSFESITRRWIEDVEPYCKHSKIILIGTKSDLREPGNPDHVSDEEAMQLVSNQNFCCYIPCSSKTGENIDSIFPSTLKCLKKSHRGKKRFRYFGFFYVGLFLLYLILCILQFIHSLFILSNDRIKIYFKDNILFTLSTYVKYVSISVIIFSLFVILIPIDIDYFEIKMNVFIGGACFYILLAIAQLGVGFSLFLISIKSDVCKPNDFEVCENLKKEFLSLGIHLLVTSLIYIYETRMITVLYSAILFALNKIFSFFKRIKPEFMKIT